MSIKYIPNSIYFDVDSHSAGVHLFTYLPENSCVSNHRNAPNLGVAFISLSEPEREPYCISRTWIPVLLFLTGRKPNARSHQLRGRRSQILAGARYQAREKPRAFTAAID